MQNNLLVSEDVYLYTPGDSLAEFIHKNNLLFDEATELVYNDIVDEHMRELDNMLPL
jgi:hypothetical protein